jgi:hypothetical protein
VYLQRVNIPTSHLKCDSDTKQNRIVARIFSDFMT